MARENKTLYAILGLLSHEDMTGYDIKKRIDYSLKLFWNAGFGQIYPSLKSLERDGLVDRRNESSDSGPERIVYSITDKGRKELVEWLSAPVEKEYVKFEILLKLFFGGILEPGDNIRNIMEFKNRSADTLKLLEVLKKRLEQVMEQNEDHVYYYLTVIFGEKVYKAYMDWADEAVSLLERHK